MRNNAALAAALRGPLMLITFGTLLAIDHSGGLRIIRSWPILIIVYGLLRLAEFAVASNGFPNMTGGDAAGKAQS
jgi:hypothetical protein